LTVTFVVVEQIPLRVYVMVVTPGVNAFTRPDEEPIEATATLLLVHIPEPISDKVVVAPAHKTVVPDIATGAGNTFTVSTEARLPHDVVSV
jgi:hypothetical protein